MASETPHAVGLDRLYSTPASPDRARRDPDTNGHVSGCHYILDSDPSKVCSTSSRSPSWRTDNTTWTAPQLNAETINVAAIDAAIQRGSKRDVRVRGRLRNPRDRLRRDPQHEPNHSDTDETAQDVCLNVGLVRRSNAHEALNRLDEERNRSKTDNNSDRPAGRARPREPRRHEQGNVLRRGRLCASDVDNGLARPGPPRQGSTRVETGGAPLDAFQDRDCDDQHDCEHCEVGKVRAMRRRLATWGANVAEMTTATTSPNRSRPFRNASIARLTSFRRGERPRCRGSRDRRWQPSVSAERRFAAE